MFRDFFFPLHLSARYPHQEAPRRSPGQRAPPSRPGASSGDAIGGCCAREDPPAHRPRLPPRPSASGPDRPRRQRGRAFFLFIFFVLFTGPSEGLPLFFIICIFSFFRFTSFYFLLLFLRGCSWHPFFVSFVFLLPFFVWLFSWVMLAPVFL